MPGPYSHLPRVLSKVRVAELPPFANVCVYARPNLLFKLREEGRKMVTGTSYPEDVDGGDGKFRAVAVV